MKVEIVHALYTKNLLRGTSLVWALSKSARIDLDGVHVFTIIDTSEFFLLSIRVYITRVFICLLFLCC